LPHDDICRPPGRHQGLVRADGGLAPPPRAARRAAVKLLKLLELLKRGMDSAAVLKPFAPERQARAA